MTGYLSSESTIANEHSEILKGELVANKHLKYDLCFEGRTTTNANQEIFIKNIPNFRLFTPVDSVALIVWHGVQWNATDKTGGGSRGAFYVTQTDSTNLITVLTAGSVDYTFEGIGLGPGYTRVRVQGVAAKTILWRVWMNVLCLNEAAGMLRDGLYTGVPS